MAEWTPGEWSQLGITIYSQRAAQVVCELSEPNPGRYIEHKHLELGSPAWDIAMANAARIVAAVNACAGISTESLEQGVVADLLAACGSVVKLWIPSTDGQVVILRTALDEAQAAISKAKGQG